MKTKIKSIILGILVSAVLYGATNTAVTTNTVSTQTNAVPAPEVNIHFTIIGNTRTYYEVYQKFISMMMQSHPDFVINTGGVVNTYNNDNEWLKFKKYSKPIFDAVPYYCAAGSKEVFAPYYYKLFHLDGRKAYFSVTNQNSLFLFMNSNNVRANDEQLTWLIDKLEHSENYTFKFLILNYPVYSSGMLGGDIKLQILLKNLIEKYEIDMVIAGNDSDYERLKEKKCVYIVSGGGGIPSTPISSKEESSIVFKSVHHYCDVVIHNNMLSFKAIDENGKIIDSFEIHKMK